MREVPSIPAGLDPKLRNVLSAVRESLNAAITNINLNTDNLAGMRQWIQPALDTSNDLVTFNESLIQASLESATGADGAAGINARGVTLTTPNQSFAYNSLGLLPAPATSVMTATAFNTTGDIYYEFFINDVSTGTATTTNTYTYTPNASFDSMPDKLEVQIREGAIDGPIEARDMMTLFGLKEGSNGITVMLSNEAHTLPNSVANVVTYTGSGTNINVWQGATALTEDSSSPYANSTFRVTAAGTGITPGAVTGTGTTTLTYGNSSAMTTDPAKIIFTIIATLKDGTAITVTKQQSLSFSNAGGRGSRQFYAYGTAWTDAAALAAVVAVDPAGVVYGDTVTISNNSSFVMVKYWNGSAWVASGIILDGSLIVTNSITAAKINSNGLSIKDAYGNIILAAGSALDFSNVGGGTKPANNATLGAYLGDSTGAGGNVTGKIGGVYIADLTVDTIHIKNNATSFAWSIEDSATIAKNSSATICSLAISPDVTLTSSMMIYACVTGNYYITSGAGTAEIAVSARLKNSLGATIRSLASTNQYVSGINNTVSFSCSGYATGTILSMPAGSYTVDVFVSHLNGTTGQSVLVNATLFVQYIKK